MQQSAQSVLPYRTHDDFGHLVPKQYRNFAAGVRIVDNHGALVGVVRRPINKAYRHIIWSFDLELNGERINYVASKFVTRIKNGEFTLLPPEDDDWNGLDGLRAAIGAGFAAQDAASEPLSDSVSEPVSEAISEADSGDEIGLGIHEDFSEYGHQALVAVAYAPDGCYDADRQAARAEVLRRLQYSHPVQGGYLRELEKAECELVAAAAQADGSVIVLARRRRPVFEAQPFVTWSSNIGRGFLVSGHYDLSQERGWADFVKRAERGY